MADDDQFGAQHQVAELAQRSDRNLATFGDTLNELPRASAHVRHGHDVACIWDNLSRMRLFTTSRDVC